MIADDIEVVTRAAGDTAETVVWRGRSDGHYTAAAGPPRGEQGTTVTPRPQPRRC